MRKYFMFSLLIFCSVFQKLQAQNLNIPPNGGNKKASVSERIGITDVAITYDRPAVKGREGKIWGQLVHYGFKNLGYGTAKESPWRAGANECTTISFSTDVKIEGQSLAAGKYGLFIAMAATEATIIFSKNSTAWGSYFYKPEEDALKVTVKTVPITELIERLKYEFLDQTENSATIALEWERLKIPFKVEVDLEKTQIASMHSELQGEKATWQNFQYAANYAADHNTNLDEALVWANSAMEPNYDGQKNFSTLSTKAKVLSKFNKDTEAQALMKEAMPLASMSELYQYGKNLIALKKPKDALEAFKLNASKFPNEFLGLLGLVRGYSAVGDFKQALIYAKQAQPKANEDNYKSTIATMISKLEQGKDVN